jgi:very-short-patch-repair endonuclease
VRWQRRDIAPPLQGRGWGGAADETEFVRQLYARAAEMRRNPTPFEIIMWKYLCRSQLSGFKFRRQHVIVPLIVDFFCPAKALALEIDGRTHEYQKDRARDAQLAKSGVKTLHFTNEDVAKNIEGFVMSIHQALNCTSDRWQEQPHPNPSPKGEGL